MPPEDELRPITGLFADVVGSTALAEHLPPDDVKALVGECVTRMSRVAEAFGGTVQAYMGDGICASFGIPQAHEDDPERAASAALSILDVVAEYARDVERSFGIGGFAVRVGVNTGRAAVGVVGHGAPSEVGLGDAVNVAARLQVQAEPGTVLVGSETARRVAPRFALEPVGELRVKGRDRTVTAFRLLEGRRSRPEWPGLPLVARELELARLLAALDELRAGRGGIVLLLGADGIGKSRLLAELRAKAADGPVWLEGACVSYGVDTPHAPFADLLRGWLDVGELDPALIVRARLRARLSAIEGLEEELVNGLGALLGVRIGAPAGPGAATAPDDAVLALVDRLAARGPVVVALEDAHWLDPSSRALAERMLELTDAAPVLVVLTLRADPGSEGHALRLRALTEFGHRLTELTLAPLPVDASLALLRSMLPVIDGVAAEEITRRAEGNPLFLEQLLQTLLDGGGFVRRRTWTITTEAAAGLPPALEGLLVSRIDRLPAESRRLAQVAAVAGRSFARDVVCAAAGLDDPAGQLVPLLRSEIVRELRRFPEPEYTFTHALLHEATLAGLTRTRLREVHGLLAAAIERTYAGDLDEHLEALARHRAGSGDRAGAIAALRGAIAHAEASGEGERAARLRARLDVLSP